MSATQTVPDVEGVLLPESKIRELVDAVKASYESEVKALRARVEALEKLSHARVGAAVKDHKDALDDMSATNDRIQKDNAQHMRRLQERAQHAEAALALAEKKLADAVVPPPTDPLLADPELRGALVEMLKERAKAKAVAVPAAAG